MCRRGIHSAPKARLSRLAERRNSDSLVQAKSCVTDFTLFATMLATTIASRARIELSNET